MFQSSLELTFEPPDALPDYCVTKQCSILDCMIILYFRKRFYVLLFVLEFYT